MKTYADTSFLFSLYATDSNSTRADAWRQANPAPLPFTGFHRLELRNALSLALFQQRLTLPEVQAAWHEVENDWLENFRHLQAVVKPPGLGFHHWAKIQRKRFAIRERDFQDEIADDFYGGDPIVEHYGNGSICLSGRLNPPPFPASSWSSRGVFLNRASAP